MSQQSLADRVGVSQSTIGNLEAGIRQSARKLPQIAHALGVNALWLAEGKGDPLSEDSTEAPQGEAAIPINEILDLLRLYGQCDQDGRRAILAAAQAAADVTSLSAADDQFKLG